MKTFLLTAIGAWLCASSHVAYAATHPHGAPMGTSAAVDSQGRIWIAYAETSGSAAHVLVSRHDEAASGWQPAVRVNSVAEPVSADGENRPKLAFGPNDEIYVTWTSPTSEKYTGDIRFARSLDGGSSWSAPSIVHRDRQLIAHRFESLRVDRQGRLWIAWVDKRDLKTAEERKAQYSGAGIYYAYSVDKGDTWRGDFKLADHSCECCRIALDVDPQGRAVAMWRHVFPPNERDHALALLDPHGGVAQITRVTFDGWKIDACPHHGPSLAYTHDGARHAVWFNQVKDQGRVFYGHLGDTAPKSVKALPVGASHADVAASADVVAVAWKRFDGKVTKIESWVSKDAGRNFSDGPSVQTTGDSDQPRLVTAGGRIILVWKRAEGTAVQSLTDASRRAVQVSSSPTSLGGTATSVAALRPFGPSSLEKIEQQYRGRSFWLVLWDLECTYCMKSLSNLAAAQRSGLKAPVVTVTTDAMTRESQINERLLQIGVRSDAYAFSGTPIEALRYTIDPSWAGEKPRAYRYSANGQRTPVTGVTSTEEFAR